MKIKQTIRNVMAGLFLVFGLTFFAMPAVTYATCDTNPDTPCCNGVDTSIDFGCAREEDGGELKESGLWSILLLAVNILVTGVGVAALAGLVYGSILYTSSGGNQEQVKKAIGIFTNVVIGVVSFAGMWALLNFLIPGGVF